LPAEFSHDLSLKLISLLPRVLFPSVNLCDKSYELMGLTFPNKIGLAAGLDKNGDHLDGLSKLGFGFIELGTVTPRPQYGNSKPRLFRLVNNEAIINRMGFNNKGVEHLVTKVKQANYSGILGINIGKNLSTRIENANDDYDYCFKTVYEIASYITVNVSSPNTPGLRELQHGEMLTTLFKSLKNQQNLLSDKHKRYVPMLAKLAPDMKSDKLRQTVDDLVKIGVDGFVFSNTTNTRSDLNKDSNNNERGGLSGRPLMASSTQLLKTLRGSTDLPIIGVGGIMTANDAKLKFNSGASLVQLYSGLIYRGPKLIRECISVY